MSSSPVLAEHGYAGQDVLEVMAEAVNYNRWLGELVTARAPDSGRLLDFGSGTGTFSRPIRARGYAVDCVELDDELRTSLQAAGFQAVKSPDQLDTASSTFIYSLNVLEHIEDDQGAVIELARVLAPGGTLLIYVPAFPMLYSSFDRRIGHFRRYRRDQVVRLVRAAGLIVDEARYADSLGFIATLAYKWLGGTDGALNRGVLRFYDRVLFPVSRVLDLLTDSLFGKNVLVVAHKPG